MKYILIDFNHNLIAINNIVYNKNIIIWNFNEILKSIIIFINKINKKSL